MESEVADDMAFCISVHCNVTKQNGEGWHLIVLREKEISNQTWTFGVRQQK